MSALRRCPSTTPSLRLPSSPPTSPNWRLARSNTMRSSAIVRSRARCSPFGQVGRTGTWLRPTFETCPLELPGGCYPSVSRADSAEVICTLEAKPCVKVACGRPRLQVGSDTAHIATPPHRTAHSATRTRRAKISASSEYLRILFATCPVVLHSKNVSQASC